MENLLITKHEFEELKESIQSISQQIKKPHSQTLSEQWLDILEVCKILRISKRTLQSYRDKGVLSFSQIGGKIYFKNSDIEKHLESHYNKAFRK